MRAKKKKEKVENKIKSKKEISSKKGKRLSKTTKAHIVESIRAGQLSKVGIAKRFKVSLPTIYRLMKNSEAIDYALGKPATNGHTNGNGHAKTNGHAATQEEYVIDVPSGRLHASSAEAAAAILVENATVNPELYKVVTTYKKVKFKLTAVIQ